MTYTASNELADLYQSILQCVSLADFQTVQKTVKMLGSLPPAATPEPVAPTPPPDIAGLVERALNYVNDPDQLEHCDPKYLRDDLEEFATALQRVAQERDAAMADRDSHQRQAIRNLEDADSYKASMREYFNRAGAAEARIATARDEGLEMAAKVAGAEYNEMFTLAKVHRADNNTASMDRCNAAARAVSRVEAAIRALKGTKP